MTDSRSLSAAALDLKVGAGDGLKPGGAKGKYRNLAPGGGRQGRCGHGGRRLRKRGAGLGGQGRRDDAGNFGWHRKVQRAFLAAAGQQGSAGHNRGKAIPEGGIAAAA